MKNSLPFLLILLLLLLSCSDDHAGGASEGELKVLSGTFVTEEKHPVEGAQVRLFAEPSMQVIDSTETNEKGYYAFSNLESGTYTINAIYTENSDTLLVGMVNSIQYEAIYDVGEKVMKKPGAIRGQISFDEVDKGGVSCYLEGTDRGALSDMNGFYTISNILPGTYSLVFEKSNSLLQKKRYGTVTVVSDSILHIPLDTLVYDPEKTPPTPKNVSATYNSGSGIAKISWSKVVVSDLAGYVLFGTGSDGKTEQLAMIPAPQTSYTDSLWRRVWTQSSKEYSYQLKARDSNNNLSILLSEKFTLTPQTGPEIDTTGDNDTVDEQGNKAVSDAFIDSLYRELELEFEDLVMPFKLAFSDKYLNAKQLTKLIELYLIPEEFEAVILFAYPSKMINPDKLYKVLVDDPNRVFLEEEFLNSLIAKQPLFAFDPEADLLSSSTLSSIVSAMEELPLDREKSGIAKLAIKYAHITQEQCGIISFAIPEGSERQDFVRYAQEHIVQ